MEIQIKSKTVFAIPFYLALILSAPDRAFAQDVCGDTSIYSQGTTAGNDHDVVSNADTSTIANLKLQEEVCQNIAISSALEDVDLTGDETTGIRLNFATAGSQDVPAIGVTGAFILSDQRKSGKGRLTANAGIAFSGEQRGSRVGLQLSW
ncbi:MAG: hypothetical protein AB8B49_02495 [Nitratireductor sp.]